MLKKVERVAVMCKEYQIRSIKCSVKIPQKILLTTVHEKLLCFDATIKTYPNFIVFSKVRDDNNLLPSEFNQNTKYTLFKYSEKPKAGSDVDMHCNIAGLTSLNHINPALSVLAKIIDLDVNKLKCKIDNLTSTVKLIPINKREFMKANKNIFQQFERFPSLFLKSESGAVILVYSSGSCVISGCKSIEEIDNSYSYLKRCFANYQNMMNIP